MTGQAFLIRYFISQDMALGTIGHAFKVGMHFGQFTRGNLATKQAKLNMDQHSKCANTNLSYFVFIYDI